MSLANSLGELPMVDGSCPNHAKGAGASVAASVARPAAKPRGGRRHSSWRGMLWLAGCLLLAGMLWWTGAPRHDVQIPTPLRAASHVEAAPAPAGRFTPIEQLRVGDRVAADNPEDGQPAQIQASAVDPATWRHLALEAELRWPDGTRDDVHVKTLQGPDWLAAHEVHVGQIVPLPLDLVEMGLPADLKARVAAVLPCPEIRPGPGRVVLDHGQPLAQPRGGTGGHRPARPDAADPPHGVSQVL